MLAPINSIKHYVQRSNAAFASGAINNNVIVDAVSAPATAATFEVIQGAVVKAIFFQYWLHNDGASGADTQVTFVVEKVPTGTAGITAAQLANLSAYANKKNILYTWQGVMGAAVDGSPAVQVANGWQLIPKGKQRMGFGDRILASFVSVGQSCRICGFATYKEYR